jgi:hypothetical protein
LVEPMVVRSAAMTALSLAVEMAAPMAVPWAAWKAVHLDVLSVACLAGCLVDLTVAWMVAS